MTNSDMWPSRLMWISAATTAFTVLLDRLIVFLVGIWGPGIAVPDGSYGDDELTNRGGDFVDIGLAVIALGLAGLAWALRRPGCGRSVLAGITAVVGPALLIGACIYTPLFFDLTPQAGSDVLTFGQAPGPFWYMVSRPILLAIAAGSLLWAVALHAWGRGVPGPAVTPPASLRWAATGRHLALGAVLALVGLHIVVAEVAGGSRFGYLIPLAAAIVARVIDIAINRALRRGRLARPHLVTVGAGANAMLWIAAAGLLLLVNPLVVEPSPMDYEVRQTIEPWAGPLLLVAVAVAVLAQLIVLLVASRRDVSAWLRRGETDQQAMASPLDG